MPASKITLKLSAWEQAAIEFALQAAIDAGHIEKHSGNALLNRVSDAGPKSTPVARAA